MLSIYLNRALSAVELRGVAVRLPKERETVVIYAG